MESAYCMEKVLMSERESVNLQLCWSELMDSTLERGKEVVEQRGISFEVGVWCLL